MTEEKLTYKLEQLTETERKLLIYKVNTLIQKSGASLNTDKNKKIVAYLKVNNTIDKDDLKKHLKTKLPEYMIPTSFIEIEKIPLLPNGKVDNNTLLKTKNIETSTEYGITKPINEIEKKLVKIWEEVLDFEPISTQDNFFEIGGDSILSIQIVSKARKVGIDLKANQIFENQTIAELSLFSKSRDTNVIDESNLVGEVSLTPIQHWFFETHKKAPHYWNQIAEVKNFPNTITAEQIEIIATKLVLHHDVLRSSFVNENNKWKANILNSVSIIPFQEFNIETFSDKKLQDSEIKNTLVSIQENIKLSEGSLFKIIYFDCGVTQKNKIFIISHHLVIDFVSWNIIFQDFELALQQITSGKDVTFNKKTDSIKKWDNHLKSLISSETLLKELPFWESQKANSEQFPTDFKTNTQFYSESSISNCTSIIDENGTSTLLYRANELYNTKIEDLLITALLQTICEWANLNHFCLGLEKQGRALDDDTIDISNTVGWFTAYFPVMLENRHIDDIGEKIKYVKEKLNKIPNNGMGFGILKYLSNTNKTNLDITPKIVFNYLGNVIESNENKKINFQFLHHGARSKLSERTYQIEINALVKNGKLNINWSYTNTLYSDDSFKKLINSYETNLNALIDYCNTKETRDYTPSDFPESGLNQEDLDNLMNLF